MGCVAVGAIYNLVPVCEGHLDLASVGLDKSDHIVEIRWYCTGHGGSNPA